VSRESGVHGNSVQLLRAVVYRPLVSLLSDQYQRPMDLTERLWCHDLRGWSAVVS
jgi:hypothetical protein